VCRWASMNPGTDRSSAEIDLGRSRRGDFGVRADGEESSTGDRDGFGVRDSRDPSCGCSVDEHELG